MSLSTQHQGGSLLVEGSWIQRHLKKSFAAKYHGFYTWVWMEIWIVHKPLCWLWPLPHPFPAFSTLPSAPGGWSCGWSLLAGSNWTWPLWATEETLGRGRMRWASCLSRLALGSPQLKLLLEGPSSEVPVRTGLWEHSGPSGEPAVPTFLP